ncbi:MAG TPA: phosphatidylglycerol lysyltransferase domain-containing protein [Acidimicrobiales bacterium]|nr:phosphatidylglycerol lysyltransferase domain-containing protein [Acidimicrobiales bacterium]
MAERSRYLALRGLAFAGLAAATLAMPAMALGCLYLLRPVVSGWPGPQVSQALELDAIPHHASVPLVAFVAVFAVGSAGLALVTRAMRLNRLSAALVLLSGVGLWTYLIEAGSVFVVLQVSLAEALRHAASMQSVYLAGALAGLAGALVAREPTGSRRAVTLIVYAVTVGALLDLLAVVVPHGREGGVVGEVATSFVPPVAAALIVPTAVLLLITSRGLSRRNRSAWRIALALLGLSALLHLLHGLDYADASVTGVITIALVARRRDFVSRTDPHARLPALERIAGFVAAAFVFGFLAIVVNRVAADLPVHAGRAAVAALRALVGLAPGGRSFFRGNFGDWLPWAVVGIEAVGVARGVAAWLAPWRHQLGADERAASRAADLVRRYGVDTLAPFALRADKDRFFYEDPAASPDAGTVLVAYRAVRGVAIITGDPVGPPQLVEAALRSFLDGVVRERGWRPTVLGASSRYLDTYRALGLKTLYHGDEAVLDVKTFSLEGPPMRTARQAVHRVERRGYRAEVRYAGDVPPSLWDELREIEAEWLGGRPKTGFVMQLDDLGALGGTDALFVIGRSPDGAVAGFLHLAVCPASRSLSLSSMPRRRTTPNGFNAFLISAAASWGREHDFVALSLNFSPFAGLLASGAEPSGVRRLERRALLAVKRRLELQLDNLAVFNRQFAPHWEPRFVAFERHSDLPRALVAMLAAEGYLPFAARVRGRSWTPVRVPPMAPAPVA